MSLRFPPPTDSEWQAYLDKIDGKVRSERTEPTYAERIWVYAGLAAGLVAVVIVAVMS